MDNASWHIAAPLFASTIGAQQHTFVCYGPYVFLNHPCAAACQAREDKAWSTESCGRCVMATRNTYGKAYILDEIIKYVEDISTGVRESEKAAPVLGSLCPQMDQRSHSRLGTKGVEEDYEERHDKTLLAIKDALIRLLDEGDAVAALPRRRGFKQKNHKLPRCAFFWARCLKKMLLFMYNDRTGRFCSGSISANCESA